MICMKNFLRFSLVSLLMTICGVMSAQVVTFDATVDLGASTTASADQITKDGVTISITNGILGNGNQYRVYKNQTMTVSSTVGNIKKMVITCTAKGEAQYGPGCFQNPTAGSYTFEEEIGTWTGDAAEFTLTAATNQVRMTKVEVYLGEVQKTLTISGTTPFTGSTTVTITPSNEDFAVYYTTDGSNPASGGKVYSGPFTLTETTTVKAVEEDYAGDMSAVVEKTFVKEDAPEITTAANIAAFKALGADTEAKLTLSNAQVLYVATNDIYVRDASGAIDFYKIGIDFSNGQILNGSITGRLAFYNDLPEMAKTDNTNANDITITAGTAEPKVLTIAQAKSETYYCDLIKIEGVKITSRQEGSYTNHYAYIGEDEIQVYDRFKVGLEYNADETYNVEGILVPYKGVYEIYLTQPITGGTPPTPGPGDEIAVANDIASFKALGADTEAKLMLKNAQVLYVATNDVYVRDASGALDLFKIGIDFSNGQILNGSITGRLAFYNDLPEMAKTDNTNANDITMTAGTAEPKVLTIAQAKSEAYYCDLIKIQGVKITAREEGSYTNYYAYIGEDEIQIYDRFKVGLEYTDDGVFDVEGILVPFKGAFEIYLTQPVKSGTDPGPGPELPKVANIAAFKALDDKTEAELTLDDAVVLYVGPNDVYVRDATGAIDFFKTGLNFVAGQVMNGTICGISTTYNGLPELTKSENTNSNGYTSASGSAVAKNVTIAEAKNEDLYCDLLRIEGVKVVARQEGDFTNIYAYNGEDEILIYDRFKVGMEYTEDGVYTVEGILVPFKGQFEIYLTQPLSGDVGPLFPVCDNIAAFKALENGTEAELKLVDAVVLYAKDRDVFVRDASGAIEFFNLGLEFENNQVLNGSIIGKFSPYQGLPEIAKTENTNADNITATEGNAPDPVVATISQLGESLLCDLVCLENVVFNTEENNTFAYAGNEKIQLFDKFKIFENQLRIGETGNVSGILVIYKGNYQIYPISFEYSEGISEMNATAINPDAPMYNTAGQRVGSDYKGLIIQAGKKVLRK